MFLSLQIHYQWDLIQPWKLIVVDMALTSVNTGNWALSVQQKNTQNK